MNGTQDDLAMVEAEARLLLRNLWALINKFEADLDMEEQEPR